MKRKDNRLPENAKASVSVALVVVNNGQHQPPDQFISVQEHDGWYLPAGRVDYGETFQCGALRETLEEAGIPVNLTGIYRIEHSGSRCRFIFGAVPSDNTPLKTVPDDETICAEWVTLKQLAQKHLRHREVLEVFTWVNSGAPIYSLDLLEGSNGNEIDNKNVVTYLVHTSKVLIQNGDKFLATKEHDEIRLLRQEISQQTPSSHIKNATHLLSQLNLNYNLTGILKISHFPPLTRASPLGSFSVTFLATGEPPKELPENLIWVNAENFTENMEAQLVTNVLKGNAIVGPLNMLTREGAPYEN